LTRYWNAILSARSTATAPSAAKGKWGSSTRDHPGQRLRQLDDDRVAVAEHRRVRHPGGLGGEGRIELGDPVPQGVDPSNEMASR